MDLQEFRRHLRLAIRSGDGDAAVRALQQDMPMESFQLAGDALLVALDQDRAEARILAERCIAVLRDRGGAGDGELADQLDAALGRDTPSDRRPVPVDLEELGDALASDVGDEPAVLDLETGEVWPALPFGFDDDVGEDGPGPPDGVRTVAVWPEGSDDAYRDMQDFVASIRDDDIADRLSIAIQGKGAFRRFRDVLDRWPDEASRWYAFSEDRRFGRARAWLADAGYRPARRTQPSAQPSRSEDSQR
jgi:hypothetical protein